MLSLACFLPCSLATIVSHHPPRFGRAHTLRCCAEAANVAIITGGSGGIGLATARRLAAQGFDCVLAYGSNDEAAASARSELEVAHGVRVRTVKGDLTEHESREATVAEIFRVVDDELGGTVAAFVHAAGFFYDGLLSHHFAGACETFEVYDAYQSIYPKAFVNLAEGCVKRMADGQGKLVCVTNPGCNSAQTHPTQGLQSPPPASLRRRRPRPAPSGGAQGTRGPPVRAPERPPAGAPSAAAVRMRAPCGPRAS